MKNDLKISLVQLDIEWENKNKNLFRLNSFIDKLSSSDIIVLPEMFATGFTMNVKQNAENMDGMVVSWMKEMAAKSNALIIGSTIIKESGKFYNRMIAISPSGKLSYYDKRHLFRMGDEDKYYSRGSNRIIEKYCGWRFLMLVCYDLRFPVWSRNKNDYDLLVYTANWPESRREVWIKLLLARAIENQCYVAAVNRIGIDINGLKHCGDSLIIDPKGNVIIQAERNIEDSITCDINITKLKKFKTDFPVWMDADTFHLDN